MDIINQEGRPLAFQAGPVYHGIPASEKSVAHSHAGEVEQLPLLCFRI